MAKRRRVRIKTPPLLYDRTQDVLGRVQKKVRGTFLTYWTSTSGSLCDNDVMAMHELLRQVGPRDEVTLLVKSDGGSGMASLRMVHLLRRYTKRLTVAAPLNCASAATMLALGADRIAMGPLSYLTAVDTSLEHDLSPVDHTNNLVAVSNDEVERVVRLWRESVGKRSGTAVSPFQELYKYLHPLVMGALDRASSLSLMLCRRSWPTTWSIAGRRSASARASTPPTPPTSTRSPAARRGASDFASMTSIPSSTACYRS